MIFLIYNIILQYNLQIIDFYQKSENIIFKKKIKIKLNILRERCNHLIELDYINSYYLLSNTAKKIDFKWKIFIKISI